MTLIVLHIYGDMESTGIEREIECVHDRSRGHLRAPRRLQHGRRSGPALLLEHVRISKRERERDKY